MTISHRGHVKFCRIIKIFYDSICDVAVVIKNIRYKNGELKT